MTGLLICAWAVAGGAWVSSAALGQAIREGDDERTWVWGIVSLALIAAALYLAWRAGGA